MFLLRKLFKAKPEVALTEEEFLSSIDEAEESGVFEENESEIIQNTLDFADTSVKEVFTPLSKMAMLNLEELSTNKLLDYLKVTPFSRLPVYVRTPNKMAGILVVKNYLNAYFINDFTSDIFTDLQGRVSGYTRLYGPFKRLDLDGNLAIDTLAVTIDNTYETAPEKDRRGRFRSMKHSGPGIGTESVKNIVARYNGVINFETKGDLFCVSVMLYLH
jgi:hypothetical protein